jgi:hypothetical protein
MGACSIRSMTMQLSKLTMTSARSWWRKRDCYYQINFSLKIKLLGVV